MKTHAKIQTIKFSALLSLILPSHRFYRLLVSLGFLPVGR